jgi:hypothetical protein
MLTQKRKIRLVNINRIGALVTLTDAIEMTENYHARVPEGACSFLYNRDIFTQLLNVPGCAGIRFINAIHEGAHTLVLVPVNNLDQHILDYPAGSTTATAPLGGKGSSFPYSHFLEDLQTVTGETGSLITKAAANDMITAYVDQHPVGIKSYLYGKEALDMLLSLNGCEAIRIYFSINSEEKPALVFVPLDARHQRIREGKVTKGAEEFFIEDPIYDYLQCPPYCPKDSVNLL